MRENKRQLQKRFTKDRLISVAQVEFARNGITNTRTIDIAKAANVSHGTVFAHFPTQEDLLVAVVEEFGIRLNGRIHDLAHTSGSLTEVLEMHLSGLTQFEGFYTRLVIERRLLPAKVGHTLTGIQSTIAFHIHSAAQREMEQGRIKEMPIHLLFNTWVGIIHYYLMNSDLFSPEGSVLKRYGSELREHFMSLIKK